MTKVRRTLEEVLLGFVVILLSVSSVAAGDKITLCHRPPGNPGNTQTIRIGASAVPAHLKHDDTLGECIPSCRDNGAGCTSGADCCSEICRNGVCASPCTADGGPCTSGSACCGGLCSDQGFCASECTAGGPELHHPACTFAAPCCPGFGSCIQGFCWTEATCSLLGEACDDLAGVVCCFDYVCDNGSCVGTQ